MPLELIDKFTDLLKMLSQFYKGSAISGLFMVGLEGYKQLRCSYWGITCCRTSRILRLRYGLALISAAIFSQA